MGSHKFLSASRAGQWVGETGCKVAPILSILCAERESGPDAELGTAVHSFCEQVISGTVAEPPAGMLADERIKNTARQYVDYVCAKRKSGYEVKLEQKLSYSHLIGGTADAVMVDDMMGMVEIPDLKTGKGKVVPAAKQNGVYLVTKRKLMGEIGRKFRFFATIVQEGVETIEWTRADLDSLERDMINAEQAVIKVLTQGVPAVEYAYASDKNCQWCPAKGICQAYADRPFDEAPLAVQKIRKAEKPSTKPAILSKEERAKIILAKPAILKWLDEVEKVSVAEAQEGVVFPGLELGVKKQGTLSWLENLEESKIIDALVRTGAVTESVLFTKAKLLTPAQVRDLGVPEDALAKLCVRSEGKAALVPAEKHNTNFE